MYLRINSPNVVREYFDGEFVVVNLENGTYYSLENVASRIWFLFERGLSFDQVLEELSRNYQMGVDQLRPHLDKFVQELSDQNLVVQETTSAGAELSLETEGQGVDIGSSTESLFSEPVIRKYSDMQDLLLLDPIHDVDNSGWPASKQADES